MPWDLNLGPAEWDEPISTLGSFTESQFFKFPHLRTTKNCSAPEAPAL